MKGLGSLIKEPTKRATYAELLVRPSSCPSHLYLTPLLLQEHPWLVADSQREVDMPTWVAGAVAYRNAKRSAGANVSSSEDQVPDRATLDAAVEAGHVVSVPKVEKPMVDDAKPETDGVKGPTAGSVEAPAANGEVKTEDMIGKPLVDGVEGGKPEEVAEEADTPPTDGIESIAEEPEPKSEA